MFCQRFFFQSSLPEGFKQRPMSEIAIVVSSSHGSIIHDLLRLDMREVMAEPNL